MTAMFSVTRHEKSGGGMRQAVDHFTLDLIDKPKRGRPRKPDALTPAQRAREYRARKRAAQEAPAPTMGLPWWKDPANKVSRLDGLTASERAARR